MELKTNSVKNEEKLDILLLSEDEKFKLTEDLIINGYCTYKFNISTLEFNVKSLIFDEQKQLTQKLSSIPKVVLDENGTRDKTISEYNLEATEEILKAQLVSINGKTDFDLSKMSKNVLSIISNKIKIFNETIDSLLTLDNLKN